MLDTIDQLTKLCNNNEASKELVERYKNIPNWAIVMFDYIVGMGERILNIFSNGSAEGK
jgi:hypothetical protein